ncbi:hypothetical protein [Dyadobacter linearis]|nr:hypothetical protein [Dyadobacter sp. CECT 9623]
MLKTCIAMLLSLFLLVNCKKADDNTQPTERLNADSEPSGTYQGYKFFNKSKKDSLAVTIKVSKVTDKQYNLEEVTPFNHIKQLEMNGMEFSFDRGTGEDGCGRISMKGTGNFKGNSLYVIETITCIKGNAPDKFVEYHATKN